MSGAGWRRVPGGQTLAGFLTALVLLSVAWPIHRAEWVQKMPSLPMVVVVSVALAGVLIGRRWTWRRAHGLTALLGVLVTLVMALRMSPGIGIGERWTNLFDDLSFWLEGLFGGGVRGGAVEFAVLMVALFWVMGFAGGWQVLRHRRPWALLAPAGLVLLLTLVNLSEGFRSHLLYFLVAGLLLLVHTSVMNRQDAWARGRLQYDRLLGLAQSGFIVGFGVVAVSLVWVLPIARAAPLDVLTERSQGSMDYMEERFGRLFSALPARQGYSSLQWGADTAFTGTPDLTDKLLFTVQGEQAQGSYWRARIYDVYAGNGWSTSPVERERWQEPAGDGLSSRSEASHDFRLEVATNTLFSAGDPVSFSMAAQRVARPEEPSDTLQVRTDDAFFPTRLNIKYSGVSSSSHASIAQLRGAGTAYPGWVNDYYLQLYDGLPDRVSALAQDLTQGASSQYDKVIAVRNHLLTYPYNLNIHAPPEGADGVDFFLFDQQTGYCDYFASSMVVLLRAAGVPARYVVGYAPGQWNAAQERYEVLELNYHSWTEVYFPEYGWVEFEATPPEAIEFGGDLADFDEPLEPLDAPDNLDPFGDLAQEGDFEPLDDLAPPRSPWLVVTLVSVALGVFAVAAGIFAWYRSWGRLSRLGAPAASYAKMVRLASLCGLGPRPEQTPLEYAALLSSRMPDRAWAVIAIASAYVHSAYHRHRLLGLPELDASSEAWKALKWALVRRMLKGWFGRPRLGKTAGAEAGA